MKKRKVVQINGFDMDKRKKLTTIVQRQKFEFNCNIILIWVEVFLLLDEINGFWLQNVKTQETSLYNAKNVRELWFPRRKQSSMHKFALIKHYSVEILNL